eukprot:scaffold307828_cov19-Tisochrysis_lutea.AAC.2
MAWDQHLLLPVQTHLLSIPYTLTVQFLVHELLQLRRSYFGHGCGGLAGVEGCEECKFGEPGTVHQFTKSDFSNFLGLTSPLVNTARFFVLAWKEQGVHHRNCTPRHVVHISNALLNKSTDLIFPLIAIVYDLGQLLPRRREPALLLAHHLVEKKSVRSRNRRRRRRRRRPRAPQRCLGPSH